jgi:hypothetical protein
MVMVNDGILEAVLEAVLEAWGEWENSEKCPCVCDACSDLSDALSALARSQKPEQKTETKP